MTFSHHSRLASTLAGLACGLLLGACGGGDGGSPQAQPVPDAPATASAKPALTVEPAVLDMGLLVPENEYVKTVTLTNNTRSPLRIARAIADCGCTTPTWPDEPIAPGASVETAITMKPGEKQGVRLDKKVTFDVEGGDPVVISVVADVALFIRHAPEAVQAPADGEQAAPAEIVLESADGVPFRVLEVSPAIVAVDAAWGSKAARHAVRIDWESWRAANRPLRLKIVTDHEQAPAMSVAIRRAPAQPKP
ncbi:MAG: DUF1573 domain-containing protein [Planctomycetota bacterium]